ncbi:alpha-ketoglutarate-dependent sulfonate dioxygenase [Ceratobasidium theobromae]|uniref:Alpha-ketoglutarate-dependent sulfonate dioxygenase n=1 Tax=Ceratobasidium theobromae TaxID=1582974 RepID=A0A5N5QJV5_9AGAM|nr:alpha-ketoglutarate-dependent sulfonate dioxygenase [Ceratobasidium theobromae]
MSPPVATEVADTPRANLQADKIFNPFYSPGAHDNGDASYEYAAYKPVFPKVSWPLLKEQEIIERGLNADPAKPNLLKNGAKVRNVTPTIGSEVTGLDLRQLTDAQKDELALLAAERGVVFLRNQDASIHDLLSIGRYYGPLHKHPSTGVPKEPGLEEVHVVYADHTRRPDTTAFSKFELWHSDVTYELQPPGTTLFKVLVSPEEGGDTLWSSGYALYSSLSPFLQQYLEQLSAVHSGADQATGSRAAGTHVRREPVENVHPLVRVHPATGLKSIFANAGFTRRIVGIPKAESDAILRFLFRQIAENPDFQVRWHWKTNDVAIFDNRVVTHAATFDFFPARRHALRVTPHAERPLSVAQYEERTGKKAFDRQKEIWKALGVDDATTEGVVKGYAD